MPADKRATRLGVLAVVAALLFGTMGVRLWFLQTVQAESLQQTVDARKTKTVRLVPERGRIFDASGRILADNQRVLTISVDWDVIRRDTDRAQLFTRLSGWLGVPSPTWRRATTPRSTAATSHCPLKEDVAPNVAVAIQERIEDFPGVSITETWKRVYPYAPLASHVLGYMGVITADDEQHYKDLGYDTSVDGESVGRAGSSCRWRPSSTASGARSPTRSTPTTASCASSASRRRSTARTSSCRSTCRCSSTPSDCCRPSSP